MNIKDKIYQLLQTKLKEKPEFFLIDFQVSSNNDIKIILDGDRGIKVKDLVDFSRAIEHNLDRDEEDFSLTVSSFDISNSFNNLRQYKKNINREIIIKTNEGTNKKGKLTVVKDDYVILEYKKRILKETGKGKKTIIVKDEIPFNIIKEAKVIIKF